MYKIFLYFLLTFFTGIELSYADDSIDKKVDLSKRSLVLPNDVAQISFSNKIAEEQFFRYALSDDLEIILLGLHYKLPIKSDNFQLSILGRWYGYGEDIHSEKSDKYNFYQTKATFRSVISEKVLFDFIHNTLFKHSSIGRDLYQNKEELKLFYVFSNSLWISYTIFYQYEKNRLEDFKNHEIYLYRYGYGPMIYWSPTKRLDLCLGYYEYSNKFSEWRDVEFDTDSNAQLSINFRF